MGKTHLNLISLDLFQLCFVCVSEGPVDILKPFSLLWTFLLPNPNQIF